MKVLIVADDLVNSSALTELLKERGYHVTASTTTTEAMKVFRETVFQMLFVDFHLPGTDATSFCRWVRNQAAGEVPVILVIVKGEHGLPQDHGVRLQRILETDADNYIVKPYHKEMLNLRLIVAKERLKHRKAHRRLETTLLHERERLQYLATHDQQTKLPNREAFVESLQNVVQKASNENPGALLFIDLDNFELINHSLGHSAGDDVLAKVGQTLRDSLRRQDTAGRFGSDDFGVLLMGAHLSEAKSIAQGICSGIEEIDFSRSGRVFGVTCSIGLAAIDGTLAAEDVLDRANSACHGAKARGRNRVEVYDDSDGLMASYREDPPRAAEVKEAIRANGFEIVFQPIVDVQTKIPAFYEVLVRLPINGQLLQPSAFVPAAERYNLMAEIDRQILTKTLTHLVKNRRLHVSFNLSGQSFADVALRSFIESSFKTAGVEPYRMTFEITETAMISNLHFAGMVMRELHEAGFHIALDDFGAGFSSFSYLKDLIPDYLKIDGSFVRDAETGRSDWTFVELINDVAHRLRIKSVAEFVEQEASLAKLRAIGVDLAQGYLFGKPGPPP
jgi:diguanylate cyclase (GGDEF)-like protein